MTDDTPQGKFASVDVPDRVVDVARDWYHVPALLALFAYMLWVRIQSWEAFLAKGKVLFAGNDAWYHYRQVVYVTKHWPETMPFDPWTHFPYGTSVGQFGTLYDQIVATVALLVFGGSATPHQAGIVLLFAPAVFGSLTIIPVYFLGKRLGGRPGGLLSGLVLALLPGLFLSRTLVGAADHNGAEPFFQGFAILGLMLAVTAAERERPVFDQFRSRDLDGIRSVVGWSILAGVATALYMWVWPPGVIVVGIFGLFLLVKAAGDFRHGTSPEHLAIPAVVSMTTAGLLMFLPFGTVGMGTSTFSFLQPILSFAVAFGGVVLAVLANEWEARDLDRDLYPVGVAVLVAAGFGAVSLVIPSLTSSIVANLGNVVGFGVGGIARTIGEAQPWMSRTGRLGLSTFWVVFLEYGLAFYTALAGALWFVVKPHLESREPRRVGLVAAFLGGTVFIFVAPGVPAFLASLVGIEPTQASLWLVIGFLVLLFVTGRYEGQYLLAVIWAAFMMSAAYTQIRYNYYLAACVAVFNAYLLREVLRGLDIASLPNFRKNVDVSRALVVILLLGALVAPLATTQTVTNQGGRPVQMGTAQQLGNNTAPGGYQNWQGLLTWMQNNTPDEGDWANANNEFPYYGLYEQTKDFNYPKGSYGVMSWWDYGHWITVGAHRIPNANPFQEGSTTAANYLLAPTEERANEILRNLDEDDAKTRYVAVDWQMIMPGSKFGAPIVFYEDAKVSSSDFYKPALVVSKSGQRYQFEKWFSRQYVKHQRYYNSTMVRLYRYHGSAMKPEPVVVDWADKTQTSLGTTLLMMKGETHVKRFENMSAARAYVKQDGTSQIGGIANLPSEYVPAMQHYRLVALSEKQLAPANYIFNGELRNAPAFVKLFERVPGATVHGEGPANVTVEASVTMRIAAFNSTFEYTQRARTGPDGEFTMVLPYSTTGYENWGPAKGYTNVSVRATGPYTFTTGKIAGGEHGITTVKWTDTANVTEAQVIGEDSSNVTVTLEKHVVEVPGGKNATASNSTNTSSLSDPGAAFASSGASESSAFPGSAASVVLAGFGAFATVRRAA